MSNDKKHKDSKKIENSVQIVRQRITDFLDRNFNRLSISAQKIILLIFGLSVGTICVFLITSSIWGKNDNAHFPVHQITIPKDIRTPEITKPDLAEEYDKILEYKQFLDSLKVYHRSDYDRITSGHPGLLDSLDQFLKRLNQQFNN